MRRKTAPRPPMLVMRGLVNDRLETRERIAVEAIVGGWGTTEHYQALADMQGVMLLAGTTDESRKWARDYAHDVIGPVLCKVRDRYLRSKKMTCTTGEFVEVRQSGRTDIGKICIDPAEWPAMRRAINRAVRACRKDNELEGPL